MTAMSAVAVRAQDKLWPRMYADERLDTLLSITGRMDGFLYRCRNDSTYTMLYIGDGIQTLTGYAPGDFVNNNIRDFTSAIHRDDLADVYAAVDQALALRRNWNMDYRLVAHSGRHVWVREVGGGVFDDNDNLVFLEGFVIDISDRKGIEDLNIKLLHELKVANDELSAQKRALELAKQRSDHSANHDALTGLPNRRAFQDKLKTFVDRSIGTTIATALLFIDLDKFKEVNDTLGHEAGDHLLRQVSAKLRVIAREEDFVARIGGDEFALLLSADTAKIKEKASTAARQVLDALQIPVQACDHIINVGCTVGIALCPEDAGEPRELMNIADRLMYVGKKSGRNRAITVDQQSQMPMVEPPRWTLMR
jgi:diguanylate cyclase (GGDEF)-like protein/PAS domain S-box-containing protein